ncbi:uncharacterized protein CLAFUR5_10108 [Fulvia fulva]|uniref:Uncharacterized protein n=1 Tax=Passalora fulva TaxID=5499 RepID=A0A9Q8PCQ5_PASFU|nr:uncharacterized protein CLAFUR5_10108 [Fulvia fulva]UJO20040.1 hypothetical protein CLAFUR5_10108 [Fulvia fulva]
MNIDAFIATVQSRLDHASDHLALMQVDPVYARRYIRLLFQGEAYKSVPRTTAWQIVDSTLTMELKSLYWWFCVREEAELVRDLQHRFKDQIDPGSPLPPKYDHALSALEVVLVNFMNIRCDMCRNQIEQRPGFSKYYRWEEIGPRKLEVTRVNPEPLPNRFFTDPLYWYLINLCAPPDGRGCIDHARLFAYLEHHLATASQEERTRVDQTVIDWFSEIAVNHQLLLTLRLSRPQNHIGFTDKLLKTEKGRVWRNKLLEAGNVHLTSARPLLLKRFYETAPPQGRRDTAWLKQYDEVSVNLATYWSAIRGPSKHFEEPDVAHFIRADLDPSHIAQVNAQRQTVLDEIESRLTIPKHVNTVQLPLATERAKLELVQTSVKTKTRPEKQTDASEIDPPTSELESMSLPDDRPTAVVRTSKRAVEVFNKMFATDVEDATQGCEWDAFVHAMRDRGFTARDSAGSAVVFELPESGRIVFHKPHPTPKIDPITLRAMRKRLHKWFGFGRESFVLGA